MADKRITDVDFLDSLNSNESFFINQNNSIKQINRNNIVFDIINGGTSATTAAEARDNLGVTALMNELSNEVRVATNDLSGEIETLNNTVNNQITTGSGNGWSYIIFSNNIIILRKNTTLSTAPILEETYDTGITYTQPINDYFPEGIKVYDASVSISAKEGLAWASNMGVNNSGSGINYRLMKANSTYASIRMSYLVVGSTIPVENAEVVTTSSGIAIPDFKIWEQPSRNMKVAYNAVRISDTIAEITLTFTYTMNGASGNTVYQQSVTPTINGIEQGSIVLKTASTSNVNWYGSPIVKTASYTINNLDSVATAVQLSCVFEDTDTDESIGTNPVTKTGTINLSLYG